MLNFLKDKKFIYFLVKFGVTFLVCYYGTLAIIGLSATKGYYNSFVDHYLDYVTWFRSTLLHGSKILLSLFGVDTYINSEYNLRQVNGRGIMIVYECVGYGIMSFWTAFVVASDGNWIRKLAWWMGGIMIFWILNISRLSLLLVATNKGWPMPLGWDHHTWFNIVSYLAIFAMIYFFEKTARSKNTKNHNPGNKSITPSGLTV